MPRKNIEVERKIKKIEHRLGHEPDTTIAQEIGVNDTAVRRYRSKKSIPPYREHLFQKGKHPKTGETVSSKQSPRKTSRQRGSKIDPYKHLLGAVKDRVIKKKANVSAPAVSRYRKREKIDSFKQNIQKLVNQSGLFETKSDAKIANDLNVPEVLARAVRYLDNLRADETSGKTLGIHALIVEAVLEFDSKLNPTLATKRKTPVSVPKPVKIAEEAEVVPPKEEASPAPLPVSEPVTPVAIEPEEKEESLTMSSALAYEVTLQSEDGEEEQHITVAFNVLEAAQKVQSAWEQGVIKGTILRLRVVGKAIQ
jgi:hypothetical protein